MSAETAEWIMAEDEKPKEYEHILFIVRRTVAAGWRVKGCINEEAITFYWWDAFSREEYPDWVVTHWMPLPKPPEKLAYHIGQVFRICGCDDRPFDCHLVYSPRGDVSLAKVEGRHAGDWVAGGYVRTAFHITVEEMNELIGEDYTWQLVASSLEEYYRQRFGLVPPQEAK